MASTQETGARLEELAQKLLERRGQELAVARSAQDENDRAREREAGWGSLTGGDVARNGCMIVAVLFVVGIVLDIGSCALNPGDVTPYFESSLLPLGIVIAAAFAVYALRRRSRAKGLQGVAGQDQDRVAVAQRRLTDAEDLARRARSVAGRLRTASPDEQESAMGTARRIMRELEDELSS